MLRIKTGDTREWRATLITNGQPVNLTGATVQIFVRPAVAGQGSSVTATAEIDQVVVSGKIKNKGRVHYKPLPVDVDQPGLHKVEFKATWADGTTETFPDTDYAAISITTALSP